MRATFILIALSLLGHQFAQPPAEWQKCLGGSGVDRGTVIRQTSDGGYIMTGETWSNDNDMIGNHGIADVWVIKMDPLGTIEWRTCLGGSYDEYPTAMEPTNDGGYIIAGHTQSVDGDVIGNHGGFDAWLVKLNPGGDIEWQKCVGGSWGDSFTSIQQTADGGYVAGGYTYSHDGDVSGNHGDADAWAVKLDASGSIQWQKCLGGSEFEAVQSLLQTSDEHYIVAGYTTSNDGDVSGNKGTRDAWIVKLDALGAIQWQKCLGGLWEDQFHSIQQTFEGGFILVGITASSDGDVVGFHGGPQDAWVVKLDASANLQWQRCIGGSAYDLGSSILQIADGGYVFSGSTSSNDGDASANMGNNAWVVRLNATGQIEWQKYLGGSGSEVAFSIQMTTDAGYIVIGYTTSNDGDVSGNNGHTDAWVVKLGVDDVGIFDMMTTGFIAAPNPTDQFVVLRFDPERHPRYATVVDATGRPVWEQSLSTASEQITIDLHGCKSGVYVLQVQYLDGSPSVERMVKN